MNTIIEDRVASGDYLIPVNHQAEENTFNLLEDILNHDWNDLEFVLPNAMTVMEKYFITLLLPVVYIIVFILGLPTNIMTIWVFLFRTKKKHPASIMMVSLALTDLLFVIWLPLKIIYHLNGENWIFGKPLCYIMVGSLYSHLYTSTIFIAVISGQRYWAVVHPLSDKFNNRVAVCVSVLVWVTVWLLSIPLYMYDQMIQLTDFNISSCNDIVHSSQIHIPAAYFMTMGIVGFVVPCIVCVVSYVLIFHHLRNSDVDSNNKEKKQKAIRLMIVVLGLFLVSFTPSNVLITVHYYKLTAGLDDDVYNLYIVALCLSSLNSCINPFVYYFISKEFRDCVKKMLMCRSKQTANRMRIYTTDTKSSNC